MKNKNKKNKDNSSTSQITSSPLLLYMRLTVLMSISIILLLVMLFIMNAFNFNSSDGVVASANVKRYSGEIGCKEFKEIYKDTLEPNVVDEKLASDLRSVYDSCVFNDKGFSWPTNLRNYINE